MTGVHTGRSLTEIIYQCYINTIRPPDDLAQCCSKHVEDYNNKRFIKRKRASSWSFTKGYRFPCSTLKDNRCNKTAQDMSTWCHTDVIALLPP